MISSVIPKKIDPRTAATIKTVIIPIPSSFGLAQKILLLSLIMPNQNRLIRKKKDIFGFVISAFVDEEKLSFVRVVISRCCVRNSVYFSTFTFSFRLWYIMFKRAKSDLKSPLTYYKRWIFSFHIFVFC